MKTQNENHQVGTGTWSKRSRLTLGRITGLLSSRIHATNPLGQHNQPRCTLEERKLQTTLAFESEAELKRVMGRIYANTIPPR